MAATYLSYEQIAGRSNRKLLLTCDHASMALPPGYAWPEGDRHLVGTHWSYDLGAAETTRELATAMACPATLSTFTRLLIDPNRALDSDTLFREHAEGARVQLNQGLEEAERKRRIDELYRPYHGSLSQQVECHPEAALLSVHSFSPVYEGKTRPMEIGILFNRFEGLAEAFGRVIADCGFKVALNEPYSGFEGVIYGVEQHALTHDRPYLEVEVRQDLATAPDSRARVVKALGQASALLMDSPLRPSDG